MLNDVHRSRIAHIKNWIVFSAWLIVLPVSVQAQDGNFRYVAVPNPSGVTSTFTGSPTFGNRSLNDNGVIVGGTGNGTSSASAFYSINGATPVLISPIAANGVMVTAAINNNGLIVGSGNSSTPTPWFYKIGSSSSATAMTAPSGFPVTITGYSMGINDNNQVVAHVSGGANSRAYTWSPNGSGLPTNAPTLIPSVSGTGGVQSAAFAVNNNGIVAGFGQVGTAGNSTPVRYDLNTPSNSTFLNSASVGLARATSINDNGVIVGHERNVAGSSNPLFAYFYTTTTRTAIPGHNGAAQGAANYVSSSNANIANISTSNLVVMDINDGSSLLKASIFSSLRSTTSFDLNTLAASGYALPGNLAGANINRNGQVAGTTNSTTAVLGTPELSFRNGISGGSGASGNWDDANAWSWGVAPSTMHPVFVNRSAAGAMTVTLDGGNKQVSELGIGTTGSGTTTLQITNRTLRVTNNDGTTFGDYTRWSSGTTTIAANGTLSLTGATLSSDQGISLTGTLISNASSTTSVVASSAGTLNFNGGTRTINVADGAAAIDLSITAPITNGGLTKSGTGNLTLSGANTYTGSTTVNSGTLAISALPTGIATNANVAGGRALTTSAITVASGAVVNIDIGSNDFASTNTGLTLSGSGTIRKSGSGSWFLGNPGGGTSISQSSTGLIDIQAGMLRNDYSNVNWSANQGTLNIAAGATADLRNNAITVGALTGAGTVDNTFTTAQVLTVGVGNASSAFSGTITGSSGAISLTKNGSGTLTLSGANTYTGGTTINAGVLSVSADNNLGATNSGLTINGGTLQVTGTTLTSTPRTIALGTNGGSFDIANAANTFTISQSLSNGGTLTKLGAGTLVLSGSADNIGLGAIVNAGSLVLGKSSSSTPDVHAIGGGAVTVSSGATLQLAGTGGDQIFDGAGVTLNGGTFDLNSRSETISSLNGTTGTVTNTTATASVLTVGSGSFAGTIQNNTGTVALVKNSTGTMTLSGPNTFTGGVTITNGTLALARDAFGSTPVLASGTVAVNSGATLRFDANNNFGTVTAATGPDVVVNGGTITNSGNFYNQMQNLTLNNGTLTGVGGFTAFGSYSVRNTLTSTGTSTISIPTSNNGYFALSATGTTTFNVSSGSLTVNANIANSNDGSNGSIVGSLTKSGTGTLILNGANTFSGTTAVAAGTLRGTGSLTSNLTVANGATLAPGVGSSGTLTLNGGLAFAGGATYGVNISSPTVSTLLLKTGGSAPTGLTDINLLIDLNNTSLTVNQSYSYTVMQGLGNQNSFSITDPGRFQFLNQGVYNITSPSFTVSSNGNAVLSFNLVPVPEPSLILGAGAVIAIVYRRLRRRS